MDRLSPLVVGIAIWACSAACGAQPAPTPLSPPSPVSISKPAPAPPLEPTDFPADCCVLEVFRPSDGYTFRLYLDGRVTQHKAGSAVEEIRPYDPTLTAHPHARAEFVQAQQATWNVAIAEEWSAGPVLPPGTRLPGGRSLHLEPLLFRSLGPDGVLSRTIEADIRHAPSLGSLSLPWTQLSRRIWAPDR